MDDYHVYVYIDPRNYKEFFRGCQVPHLTRLFSVLSLDSTNLESH